jgi:hypothetical protein
MSAAHLADDDGSDGRETAEDGETLHDERRTRADQRQTGERRSGKPPPRPPSR